MDHISTYTNTNSMPEKQNQKLIIVFLIGLILGAFGFWVVSATKTALITKENKTEQTPTQQVPQQQAPQESDNQKVLGTEIPAPVSIQPVRNESVIVPNQSAGTQVIISKAVLEQDGWVVVHEGTASHIGNALGAARFDQGEHGGVVELLRPTVAGQTYRAILYRDNGDRVFNLSTDFPFLENNNQPIIATFVAQ